MFISFFFPRIFSGHFWEYSSEEGNLHPSAADLLGDRAACTWGDGEWTGEPQAASIIFSPPIDCLIKPLKKLRWSLWNIKLSILKLKNTVAFSTSAVSGSHPLYLVLKHFHSSKIKPCANQAVTPHDSLPSPRVTANLLFYIYGFTYSGYFT